MGLLFYILYCFNLNVPKTHQNNKNILNFREVNILCHPQRVTVAITHFNKNSFIPVS